MLTPMETTQLADRMMQAVAEDRAATLKRREVVLVESLLHALLVVDDVDAKRLFMALRDGG